MHIIGFNYAGSLDNGKLLIGTFPNESDDGESRVYKLIYARTRYFHATDLSQYSVLQLFGQRRTCLRKNRTVFKSMCEFPFVSHNMSCSHINNLIAGEISEDETRIEQNK